MKKYYKLILFNLDKTMDVFKIGINEYNNYPKYESVGFAECFRVNQKEAQQKIKSAIKNFNFKFNLED